MRQNLIDLNHALAIELHIRFFKKEAKIVEVLYREVYPETLEDTGFTPIGLDEPYRIVVGNNPVNYTDPMGLFWGGVITKATKFIINQFAKWGVKDPMDKIVPPMNPSIPEEGDDDNDGIPNFQDPDSPWCTTCKKCH